MGPDCAKWDPTVPQCSHEDCMRALEADAWSDEARWAVSAARISRALSRCGCAAPRGTVRSHLAQSGPT